MSHPKSVPTRDAARPSLTTHHLSLRIGVLSDTHGYLDPRVEKIFAGVDHILHAGDIGDAMIELELKFIAPVTVVQGNVDAGLPFKLTEVVTLARKKFLVHHIVNPWALSETVAAELSRQKPDAVIFGHTHKALAQTLDGVFFFNPGYAGKPRFGAPRSVALLHLAGNEIRPELIPL